MRQLAIRTYGKPLEEIVVPLPSCKGNEVLLKTLAAGVCHSDLHMTNLSQGKKMPWRSQKLPCTPGHENVGEVIARGEEVPDTVKLGSKVLIYPWLPVEDSNTYKAGYHIGAGGPDGGFATHILVPHYKFCVDVSDLPEEKMCLLACSGLTAYSALKKARNSFPTPTGTIVIIGAGGVGLQGIRMCQKVTGVLPIVCDISDESLKVAQTIGGPGTKTVNSRDEEAAIKIIVKHIQETTTVKGKKAPDVVVDFVGNTATASLAMRLLGGGYHSSRPGKYIIVGMMGGTFKASLPMFPYLNLAVEGTMVGSLQEMKELVECSRKGEFSHDVPVAKQPLTLESVIDALEKLKKGKATGRIVLMSDMPSINKAAL